MIPNSLLPRKGENEKIFTHVGERILGVSTQESGVRVGVQSWSWRVVGVRG